MCVCVCVVYCGAWKNSSGRRRRKKEEEEEEEEGEGGEERLLWSALSTASRRVFKLGLASPNSEQRNLQNHRLKPLTGRVLSSDSDTYIDTAKITSTVRLAG